MAYKTAYITVNHDVQNLIYFSVLFFVQITYSSHTICSIYQNRFNTQR